MKKPIFIAFTFALSGVAFLFFFGCDKPDQGDPGYDQQGPNTVGDKESAESMVKSQLPEATGSLEEPKSDDSATDLSAVPDMYQLALQVLEGEDPDERKRQLYALIDQLDAGNVEAFRRALESRDPESLTEELKQDFLVAWARFDPRAATEYALNLNGDNGLNFNREGVALTMEEWASTDPAAAMDWLLQWEPETSHALGQVELMRQWAEQDPGASGDWLNAHLDEPGIGASIKAYVTVVSKESPTDAFLWADNIGSNRIRIDTFRTIAVSLDEAGLERLRNTVYDKEFSEEAASLIEILLAE